MFSNKNYERDVDYAFRLSRFVFRLLGDWPYARARSWLPEAVERVAVVLVSNLLLTCELVPAILYMAIVQRETRARLKVLATVIFALLTMAKYGKLLISRDQMRNCLAQVEDDWRNVVFSRDRDAMLDKVRTGRCLLITGATFMYSTGVSFRTIIPLSHGKIVTKQSVTIRHLPCPSYFVLFDVQLSPAYELVFLAQFFSDFVKCTITTAVYGLAGTTVMHICAQLEILIVLMNNLFPSTGAESPIQYASLMEILGLAVCLIGYFVILEWEDNNAAARCPLDLHQLISTFSSFALSVNNFWRKYIITLSK
ncbi:PREDICTED: uncharacterized protein LOC105448028 [Wasmannia auropunctata]|uniref:uncharacterized protein LOC105448028 n=1 Tax=Wasmannia auropunctata TaxID=64793 RepID=UPI0005F0A406|nr:PREDICTED: uncharacterized protein LOC105448028 [Wasmannia auropunctata]